MLATGTDENSEVMEKLYAKLGKVAGDVKQAYAGGDGFVLADGSTSIALENETYAKKPQCEEVRRGMWLRHDTRRRCLR